MASLISAGTATNTAVSITGDTTGALALATNNGVTAVTIDTSQVVTLSSASNPSLIVNRTTSTGDAGLSFQSTGTGVASLTGLYGGGLRFGTGSGDTERMRIDSSGNVGIGTSSPSTKLSLQLSSATTYTTSTRTNQGLIIYNSSATTNGFTGIEFVSEPTTGNGGIAGIGSVVTASGSANLVFGTRDSSTYAERMRIDSSGSVLIGNTNTNPSPNNVYGIALNRDGNGNYYAGCAQFSANGTAGIIMNRGSDDGQTIQFRRTGSNVGNISVSTTATSYNTSSDYRLKDNIAPMTGALTKVQALKPVTYKWKVDGTDAQGFIAHELQAVVPDCVTGEKDAVDADGNPVYQSIDTSFLVATLTAAIQELKTIVDAQAVEIAALKAKVGS